MEDRSGRPTDEPAHALVLLFGRVRGGRRRFDLGIEPCQLGREPDHEHSLQLDDPRASRQHAEVAWSEVHRGYWVRDLGSRNGVFLNGVRVARELLTFGDLLRVGETVFRFAAAEPHVAEPGPIEPPFVGASRSLRRSIDMANRVAGSNAPVLVLGPTGTGKELVAAAIHRASRRSGALVPVNCAALPAHLVESELFGHEKGAFSGADAARIGLFRAAQGGTLFLDEVGELPPEIQAKLLRVLDARTIRPVGSVAETPVNVRVVAATNRDLASEAAEGRFRPDLYARLTESVVRLDPLCERPEDLEPLWIHFIAQLGSGVSMDLSGATFEAMALYAWPYNVRELRQLARSALVRKPDGGELALEDLPAAMQRPRAERPERTSRTTEPEPPPAPSLLLAGGEVPTARQLRALLEEFHGNVKDVAAFLGKDRKQIYRWLQRDHIDPGAYRRGQ